MERRTKAIILISLAIVALILAILWIFLPLWQNRQPAEQPPAPAPAAAPSTPGAGPNGGPVLKLPTDGNSPEEKERQAQERLKQFAMDFVSHAATYSSTDGFVGIRDAYLDAASDVRKYLDQTQAQLKKDHPVSGPSWGQTAKPLAPRISSALPVLGKTTAEVTVQTQLIVMHDGKQDISYQEAVVTMAVLEGGWKATRLEWKPFNP